RPVSNRSMEQFRAREGILCLIAEDVELWWQPVLSHRSWTLTILCFLLLCADPNKTDGQQPFVHSNDVQFSFRTDRTLYNIGDQIVIYYSIKNVSNGAMYVPRSQWDAKCGNPPHLWSRLEDSF